jgi:uncharacterized protein YacL
MDYSFLSAVIVAILSLIGTLSGSALMANKTQALLEFRLATLEEKVDKHNQVIERTYQLEQKTAILDERIDELRKELRNA